MHLADAFIQSDLQWIQAIHFLSVCVFPGNWTHNLCAANVMLYHWATGTRQHEAKFMQLQYAIIVFADTLNYIFIVLCFYFKVLAI